MSNSTEKRVLTINPDLFKVSKNNSTRKNNSSSDKPSKIKIRDPMKKTSGNSRTLKRNLLNYIRKQQDRKAKNIFQDNESTGGRVKLTDEIVENNDNSQFNDSMEYLMNLTKEKEMREKMEKTRNQTLKRHESVGQFESTLYNQSYKPNGQNSQSPTTQSIGRRPEDFGNVPLNLPSNISNKIHPDANTNIVPFQWKHYPPPTHGCLKNGNLPTYRVWKNQTQRIHPSHNNINGTTNGSVPLNQKTVDDIKNDKLQTKLQEMQNRINNIKNTNQNENNQIIGGQRPHEFGQRPHEFDNNDKRDREAIKTAQIKQMPHVLGKDRRPGFVNKQRKTIRRTYNVGKSKRAPKVSVLISNKTIRKNVLTKTHLMHQVPIHEVKKYLIKKGFIRVGSIAPTDVLRKMYESALLMCGEIENHNPDNLLYNYMHTEHDMSNK